MEISHLLAAPNIGAAFFVNTSQHFKMWLVEFFIPLKPGRSHFTNPMFPKR